jgi:hypothetical protein
MSAEELDHYFRETNGGAVVVIPAEAHSCTYIRRAYLEQAGDSWSIAPASGWQHVLAAGIFVYGRVGPDSVSEEAPPALTPALRTRSDASGHFRFAVSAARLKHCGMPVILAVDHAIGGGVSQSILQLGRTLRGRAEFVRMTPADNAVILESVNPDFACWLAVDVERDYQALLDVLRRCGVARMHVHHTHGYRFDLNQLRRDLGVPFDFTAHDYHTVCPQLHLTDAAGGYCGEPDEAGCNRCLAVRPSNPPRSIESWRREHEWLLREADRLLAPSRDTANRLARHVPNREILVVPAEPSPGSSVVSPN